MHKRTDHHRGANDEFSIFINLKSQLPVVFVHGELNEHTAMGMCAAIQTATGLGHMSVVFDLSEVTHMGAPGLRALAECAITLTLFGGALTLRSPSPCVQSIVSSSGLKGLLPAEGTLVVSDAPLAAATVRAMQSSGAGSRRS